MFTGSYSFKHAPVLTRAKLNATEIKNVIKMDFFLQITRITALYPNQGCWKSVATDVLDAETRVGTLYS